MDRPPRRAVQPLHGENLAEQARAAGAWRGRRVVHPADDMCRHLRLTCTNWLARTPMDAIVSLIPMLPMMVHLDAASRSRRHLLWRLTFFSDGVVMGSQLQSPTPRACPGINWQV